MNSMNEWFLAVVKNAFNGQIIVFVTLIKMDLVVSIRSQPDLCFKKLDVTQKLIYLGKNITNKYDTASRNGIKFLVY